MKSGSWIAVITLMLGLYVCMFTSAAEVYASAEASETSAVLASDTGGTHPSPSEGHGGHGAHNGPNPLNPLAGWNTDLVLWTLITFSIVCVLLYIYAWGPIMEGLDKREKSVADNISAAEEANRKAEELLKRHQEQLAQAKLEIAGMLEEAQARGEKAAVMIRDKAQRDAEEEIRRAHQEITAAKSQAMKELSVMSATMAVDLAGKILRKQLDSKAHAQLIEQAVKEFGK